MSEIGFYHENMVIAEGVDRTNYSIHDGLPVYQKGEVTYIGGNSIDKNIVIDSLLSDTALFSSDLNLQDLTLRYELLNIKDLAVVHDFGRLPIVLDISSSDNKLYFQFDGKLQCFSLSSNKVKWTLEGAALVLLGIYQNQLLIACSDHRLMSVDAGTGEIISRWRELPGFEEGQFYKDVLPEPSDFVLDKESGLLIGVFSRHYLEIDLKSGKLSYEDIRQELYRHGINSFRRMGKNPFTKDHLFLTAHAELDERPNVDLDCVLALNRNTRNVDWVHIFKDTGLGTNVPQITSTHLYQLDTEGKLYVFEKQNLPA